MATTPIDYDALAKQHGATVDYDTLAQQHGGEESADEAQIVPTQPGSVNRLGDLPTLKANYQDLMTPKPGQHGHEFFRGMGENLIAPAVNAIQHPVDTLAGLGKSAVMSAPPVALYNQITGHPERIPGYQAGNDMATELQENGVKALPHLAGQGVGLLMGGELAGGAGKLLGKAGNIAREGAAGLNNAAIGTSAGDMAYGANPGKALSTNRIMGLSPASVASKVESRIPAAVEEHRGIVGSAPQNTLINTGPIVSDPFNAQLAEKTNPRTGVANTAQIRGSNRAQSLLTNVIDPSSGKPTMMMRDPNLTPLEATDLKSNIYGMTKYDPTGDSTMANTGLKGAAHGLKSAVEQAVPESIPSGQRLHNLMAAKDVLAPSSASRGVDLSKSGLFKNAATAGMTGGAAGLDLLGNAAQNVGPGLNLIAPPLARTSVFANARKKDENQ